MKLENSVLSDLISVLQVSSPLYSHVVKRRIEKSFEKCEKLNYSNLNTDYQVTWLQTQSQSHQNEESSQILHQHALRTHFLMKNYEDQHLARVQGLAVP